MLVYPGPGDRGPQRRAAACGDGLSVAVRRPLGDWHHLVPLLPRDHPDQLQPVRRQRVRRPGRHVPDAASSEVGDLQACCEQRVMHPAVIL